MERFAPLTDLFAAYRRRKLRGASPGTLNQYQASINNFAMFLGQPARISDLSDESVLDAMHWLIDRGRAPATANKFRSNVLAMWRFAARRGWLSVWPEAEKLTEPKRIPVAWSRDELKKLWDLCASQRGTLGGVPAGLWWNGLHAVIWDTSERISAAVNVPRDRVSLDTGTIIFPAELRKGRTEDQFHRLHPTTVALLRAIWRPERKLLFAWPYCRNYLWIKYRAMLRSAGLPDDRLHKFHCMRRSVASYYEAAGGNATWLLGHSSRDVTVRHYLDPRICGEQQSACDVLFRPHELAIAGA